MSWYIEDYNILQESKDDEKKNDVNENKIKFEKLDELKNLFYFTKTFPKEMSSLMNDVRNELLTMIRKRLSKMDELDVLTWTLENKEFGKLTWPLIKSTNITIEFLKNVRDFDELYDNFKTFDDIKEGINEKLSLTKITSRICTLENEGNLTANEVEILHEMIFEVLKSYGL